MKQVVTSSLHSANAKTSSFYGRIIFSALAFFLCMGTAYADSCYSDLMSGSQGLRKVTIQQAPQGEGQILECHYYDDQGNKLSLDSKLLWKTNSASGSNSVFEITPEDQQAENWVARGDDKVACYTALGSCEFTIKDLKGEVPTRLDQRAATLYLSQRKTVCNMLESISSGEVCLPQASEVNEDIAIYTQALEKARGDLSRYTEAYKQAEQTLWKARAEGNEGEAAKVEQELEALAQKMTEIKKVEDLCYQALADLSTSLRRLEAHLVK